MADCGTLAGYHAHRRRDEDACGPCRGAMAEDKREKRLDAQAQAASSFEEAINNEPEVGPGLDALADLRASLRIVRAAMRVPKSTRDIASLAKQRAELVREIAELEAELNKAGGVLGGYEAELSNILRPDFEGRTGT